ncbi:MAG: helix-turn-helix domain-containing protein [Candidatus Acidiferrales bacterium]|jgi:AcrR family transcriptional regulator
MLYRDGTRLIIRDHAFRPSRSSVRPRRGKSAPSRQQARTEATRRRLLAAAERIFARKGFEAARLEDIAALAGYTRGAFYANFESKEDIFFALLEQWVAERLGDLDALFERYKDPAKLLRALRDHYADISKNRDLALLSVEFKLFAVRHPKEHARLLARHESLRAGGGIFLDRVAKSLGRTIPIQSAAASTALGAMSNALVLDHLLDHTGLAEQDIQYLLGIVFDGILGATAAK